MGKQIAITDTFLNSVFKLNNQDRKLAFNTAKQIAENPKAPSLHLHSIDREKCDKKFMSARINLDLRMILVNRGEISTLLYVDHHDAAYDWCEGKYLLKSDFGAEYIYDEKLAEGKLESFQAASAVPDYLNFASKEKMFQKNGIKKKQLEKLGIQSVHVDNLMEMDDDEQLLAYIEIFPDELQEALIDLATGTKSFDVVYNDLFCKDDKDKQDFSVRRFYLTEDMDELEKLMENEDFEKWTLFLHPSQEKLVNMNCNGPMLIEGGPGTGKTIVGIHRAVRLASSVFTKENECKILFCTFSKKLAKNIKHKIDRLCEIKGIPDNIDVMSVDSYVAKMLGNKALPIDINKLEEILKDVFRRSNWRYSLEFFIQEYYEVVEKYNIDSLEEYLNVKRVGSGQALTKSAREEIWPYFDEVRKEKKAYGAYSFVDRAYQLESAINENTIHKVYDSIVIDEAQDLESIKLKALCMSIKNEQNAVCILSDRNQRIFRLNSWANEAGVNIVGRTYYLRVNYRTTKQINDYARSQFMEFDRTSIADKEYISIMSGDEPEIIACETEGAENRLIVERAKQFMSSYSPDEICVLAPTREKMSAVNAIFEYEDIKTDILLGDDIPLPNGHVKICTTSGVKGLEFSVVIICSYNKIGTQRQNYGCAPEALVNYEKLVECEKYVAVTRARDKVLITYLGE